jgi:hypothetical protein
MTMDFQQLLDVGGLGMLAWFINSQLIKSDERNDTMSALHAKQAKESEERYEALLAMSHAQNEKARVEFLAALDKCYEVGRHALKDCENRCNERLKAIVGGKR